MRDILTKFTLSRIKVKTKKRKISTILLLIYVLPSLKIHTIDLQICGILIPRLKIWSLPRQPKPQPRKNPSRERLESWGKTSKKDTSAARLPACHQDITQFFSCFFMSRHPEVSGTLSKSSGLAPFLPLSITALMASWTVTYVSSSVQFLALPFFA